MFSFIRSKSKPGSTLKLSINGMHCTSCSLNIDGELEDTPGIFEASTSYAKSITTVTYDPTQITPDQIIACISQTGYQAQIAK